MKIDPQKLAKELSDIVKHRECVRRSGIYLASYLKRKSRGADSTALILRCEVHDISKLQNLDEFMALASIVDEMSDMHNIEHTLSDRQKNAISLHWANNSHHPEHFESPNDMSELDLMEMACDCHARSKQFGNSNVCDYLRTQQEERFHFDSGHFTKLLYYGQLLDKLTLDDDYRDIIENEYNLGFNFTDRTVMLLENFKTDSYSDYLYTDRLYLRRKNDTDFATVQYEIHLKDVNTMIGLVSLRYNGDLDFKIYENYRGFGYGLEVVSKIIDISNMEFISMNVRKDNVCGLSIVNELGFIKTSEGDSYDTYELERVISQDKHEEEDIKKLALKPKKDDKK